MNPRKHTQESSLIFDDFDIDLVVKVLENTAFSPFFLSFIPVFYFFHGARATDPTIVLSSIYFIAVSAFCGFVKWFSRLYRNQGSLLYRPQPLDWSDQIVVITGGASGVGELLANTLAVRNVSVVVLDVKPITSENSNISYYKCDVSRWEEVKAVSERIIGEPTMIINNAGVVQGKLLLDLSPADIQQSFGVNIMSHFYVIKAFLPYMLKRKAGHIVTVASVMGMVGVAQTADYCATKAAAISLHESLRYELDKRYNCPAIRTTLICPGHVSTALFKTINFPNALYFRFFCPTLQPVAVVKRIVTSLDQQHSQAIFMPFYVHFVPYIGHLPSFGRDFFQWIVGADYCMVNFVKSSGLRPEEDARSSSVVEKKSQ